PQRRAVARAQRERVAGDVAGERQAGAGGQHAGGAGAVADLMAPSDRAGPIVDRANRAPSVQRVVGARPPERAVLRLEEVDAVAVLRRDDEQAAARIEAR